MIAGAGLDAFAHEPLGDSPLTTLPNVVMTPHAGSATTEAANRMSLTAAQEVVRVLAGEEPRFRVN
jgi:D-3-phosphoglycerate dehydrogenase